MAKVYKPVVLVILDGFGVNKNLSESTWNHTEMPTLRDIEKYYPFTTLQASGIAVGLPWGVEGNSEVGHFTIGAGKALFHHLPRIIMSIHEGTFFTNNAFKEAAEFIKKGQGKLHIMGLYSSGSVHAYAEHLDALLEFAKKEQLPNAYLHLFTDGRDAPLKEAGKLLTNLEKKLNEKFQFAKIASLSGRNFAMDRDRDWGKIEKVYKCLATGMCATFSNASEYVNSSYEKGLTDEFIEPACLESKEGRIEAGDAVIFFNFREDSVRELTSAFVSKDFSDFERAKIQNLFFLTMTEYDKKFPVKVAFPPLDVSWPLARVISESGFKQLHVAETGKYAHVTYFFNGGREEPFPKEVRVLVPSEDFPSYDEIPEMSADKVTDAILEGTNSNDFILANFANADMVGHTGNFNATVKALEALDHSLGKMIPKILENDGVLIVTADHGNAEEKIYSASGEKRTKHTTSPVPFYVVGKDFKRKTERTESEIAESYGKVGGLLSDVAPTVIELMGLRKPSDMSGVNLLPKI